MMLIVESSLAWAGGGHHHRGAHIGIYLTAPLVIGAGYYAAPTYYYPAPNYLYQYPNTATVYGSSVNGAPTYIERGTQQQAGQDQSGYWYFCNNPQGYYPNVAQCPGGWQQVMPRR